MMNPLHSDKLLLRITTFKCSSKCSRCKVKVWMLIVDIIISREVSLRFKWLSRSKTWMKLVKLSSSLLTSLGHLDHHGSRMSRAQTKSSSLIWSSPWVKFSWRILTMGGGSQHMIWFLMSKRRSNGSSQTTTSRSSAEPEREATTKCSRLQWKEVPKDGKRCTKTSSGSSAILQKEESQMRSSLQKSNYSMRTASPCHRRLLRRSESNKRLSLLHKKSRMVQHQIAMQI